MIVLAVKLSVDPSHTGVLLPAVGAGGVLVTVTETEPGLLVHPANVAVTEYIPASKVVALTTLGF